MRGLVLIDPPYSDGADLDQTVAALTTLGNFTGGELLVEKEK